MNFAKRDAIVVRIANAIMRLASPDCQAFMHGAVEYGMRAAAQDNLLGRDAPLDWRDAGTSMSDRYFALLRSITTDPAELAHLDRCEAESRARRGAA